MKVRLGFVSNSSSSAFILVGYLREYYDLTTDIKDEFLEKLMKTTYLEHAVKWFKCNGDLSEVKDYLTEDEDRNDKFDPSKVKTIDDMRNILEIVGFPECPEKFGIEEILNFEIYNDSNSEILFIGGYLRNIGEDETLRQYKDRIHAAISEVYSEYDRDQITIEDFVKYC